MRQLLIVLLFIGVFFSFSFSNTTERQLRGKWYKASGAKSTVAQKDYIEFTSNSNFTSSSNHKGTYNLISDSQLAMSGYTADSLYSMCIDGNLLILVGSKNDSILFLREDWVYPSEKSLDRSKFEGHWHKFGSYWVKPDTLVFTEEFVARISTFSKKEKSSYAKYRILSKSYIEVSTNDTIHISKYVQDSDFLTVIARYLTGDFVSSLTKISNTNQEKDLTLYKDFAGTWVSSEQEIILTNAGKIIGEDDSLSSFMVVNDSLLFMGNKHTGELYHYYLDQDLLTLNSNPFFGQNSYSSYVRKSALLPANDLKRAYMGEWQFVTPQSPTDTSSPKGYFYLVEDSTKHLYEGSRRINSFKYWTTNGTIFLSDDYNTLSNTVLLKDDTLFYSKFEKLVRCKERFLKDTQKAVFKDDLPGLSMHKILPLNSLDTWLKNPENGIDTSMIRKTMTGKDRLINYSDSVAISNIIAKNSNENDSVFLVIGPQKEFRTKYCMLYLAEKANVLDGSLVEKVEITAGLGEAGTVDEIYFYYNETGKDILTKLTTDFGDGTIALFMNGYLFSINTNKKLMDLGIIRTILPNPNGLPVTEGLNMLKSWGSK